MVKQWTNMGMIVLVLPQKNVRLQRTIFLKVVFSSKMEKMKHQSLLSGEVFYLKDADFKKGLARHSKVDGAK